MARQWASGRFTVRENEESFTFMIAGKTKVSVKVGIRAAVELHDWLEETIAKKLYQENPGVPGVSAAELSNGIRDGESKEALPHDSM